MTPDEIIHAFFVRQCGIHADHVVDPLMSLRTSLKMDLLDWWELRLTLEEDHGIIVEPDVLMRAQTVGDLRGLVRSRIQ